MAVGCISCPATVAQPRSPHQRRIILLCFQSSTFGSSLPDVLLVASITSTASDGEGSAQRVSRGEGEALAPALSRPVALSMMGAGAGILEAERLRGDGKFPAPELMMRRRGAGELPLLARSAKALGIEARRVETAQRNEVQRSWLHSREPGRLWRNAHKKTSSRG